MRRSANIRALAAILAVFDVAGCQLIASLQEPTNVSGGADATTSVEASPEPTTPLVDPCATTLPQRPDAMPQPADLRIDLVFNYYDSRPQPPDAGVDLCDRSGFDLDLFQCGIGIDTGADADADADADAGGDAAGSDAAQDADADDANSSPDVDAGLEDAAPPCRRHCGTERDDGIDDKAGKLFAGLRGSLAVNSESLDPVKTLEHGAANVLMRIDGYNGLPDDEAVTVSFFALSGLAMDSFPSPEGGIDASDWLQTWDRRSIRSWYVEPSSVDPLTLLPRITATGWVRDHVLVVQAERVPAYVGVTANLEHATITGKLVPSNGRWSLTKGRIGGEFTLSAISNAVQALAGRDRKLCESLQSGPASSLCQQGDRGTQGDRGVDCNALSIGASFTMVEGRLGPIRPAPASDKACPTVLCPPK